MVRYSGRIGRAAGVYPDSARLLHYRVHQRVKSVTTYITAVAERHTPLPWWSAIFFSSPVQSQTVVGGCRDTRKDKKDCVPALMYVLRCMYVKWVCLFDQAHFNYSRRDTCVLSLFGLTICGLSCTHQGRCATIAKVPVVGAAQRDKTGKMTVSEAPLNIIRLWWMGSTVGFGTISLAIKHAWGESFITSETKPPCPSHVFQHRHGKSLFPWQPNWLSLSQEWGRRERRRRERRQGRGCRAEAWHSVLTSTWPLGEHTGFLLSWREKTWLVVSNETKTSWVAWVKNPSSKFLFLSFFFFFDAHSGSTQPS